MLYTIQESDSLQNFNQETTVISVSKKSIRLQSEKVCENVTQR